MAMRRPSLTRLLERASPPVFVGYATFAAFSTYFCMYAFRKPFAAASFAGQTFLGSALELKTALVISQIVGYTLSKYLGIRVCSEITPARRAFVLVVLIVWAELALVLFGILPTDLKVVAIFLNGLPLGMVWGLVVGFLEGRRTSEVLLAGLSSSYIVASGVVKDFGRAVLSGAAADWWAQLPLLGSLVASAMGDVREAWMPAVTGLHFLPLFLLAVWALQQIPQPDAADVAARGEREPMRGDERRAFLRQFAFGMVLLCVSYLFLTAYRDFRDNYQVEILSGLGYEYQDNRAIITQTETLVMAGVMVALAALGFIQDNRRGLLAAYGIMTFGSCLLGISTALLDAGVISGFWWMTLTGLGAYLAYVPVGSVLFERIFASTRFAGTAVFAIYVADAIGYTGSVGVQLYRDLAHSDLSRLGFFRGFSYCTSLLGVVCLLLSGGYFVVDRGVRSTRR
jgi:Family of unknown function (DUF5690)